MATENIKKLLIFVLSCEAPPYNRLMQTSLETWDTREVEGCETIFYCGKSHKKSTDKIAYLETEDSFLTMGRKTVEAFEWALKNKDFDFIARPNASCYVRKERLMKYVQLLPREKLFIGLKVESIYKIDYLWGGGQYIISRDVVQMIVDNKEKWNHRYTEDVSIADLVMRLGITLNGNGRACSINKKKEGGYFCISYGDGGAGNMNFMDMEEMKKLDSQFFIRVKQDGDRDQDIHIMQELFRCGI